MEFLLVGFYFGNRELNDSCSGPSLALLLAVNKGWRLSTAVTVGVGIHKESDLFVFPGQRIT